MAIYKESSRISGFSEIKSLSQQKVLSDLKFTIDGCKHCDVALLVEGKQFRASKAILAAQSPVFEAMFSLDMKEKYKSQVSLSNVSAHVFEQFLNYLFTGELCNTMEIMELLQIADMYIINSLEYLKQQCEHILCQHITSEDVIELLNFSQRYSLSRLAQICSKFITDHYVEIIESDSWKFASKIEPTLLAQVFRHLALKYQHNEFPDCVPLDLPLDVPFEETMTHHVKYDLNFKKFSNRISGQYSWTVCPDSNPDLKFRLLWNFCLRPPSYELFISYLSLPMVFVDISVTCKENFWTYLQGTKYRSDSNILCKYISRELSTKSNEIRVSFDFTPLAFIDNDISLKMSIYKKSSRETGFPEIKSLLREQTLMDLKSMFEGGKFLHPNLCSN